VLIAVARSRPLHLPRGLFAAHPSEVSEAVKRSALVTGASAGIGLAVSRALASDGYSVTMVARRVERLHAAMSDLQAEGYDVVAEAIDVTDDGANEALVVRHLDRFGRLDVAVANAGIGYPGTATGSKPHEIERMFNLNFNAPHALASAAVPALRETATSGGAWFIVVASISGVWPTAGLAAYSASKAAAVSLATSLNTTEASAGVRSCAICPAFVDTEMTTWTHDTVPAAGMLRAEDVAESVRFLVRLSRSVSVPELILQRSGTSPYTP
jgi:3-oxoacyl-[acyl-carrier protein] reductase